MCLATQPAALKHWHRNEVDEMSTFITNVSQWATKCIEDPLWLAGCMQRIHRFGGQFPGIDVLGHSMQVASRLNRPIDKLWGLLHDAHEVLSGDVTRGFKTQSMLLKQIECDRELITHLYMRVVGDQHVIDRDSVHEVDVEVGDYEHESPIWSAIEYSTYTPSVFVEQFKQLLRECQ